MKGKELSPYPDAMHIQFDIVWLFLYRFEVKKNNLEVVIGRAVHVGATCEYKKKNENADCSRDRYELRKYRLVITSYCRRHTIMLSITDVCKQLQCGCEYRLLWLSSRPSFQAVQQSSVHAAAGYVGLAAVAAPVSSFASVCMNFLLDMVEPVALRNIIHAFIAAISQGYCRKLQEATFCNQL